MTTESNLLGVKLAIATLEGAEYDNTIHCWLRASTDEDLERRRCVLKVWLARVETEITYRQPNLYE